MSESQKSKRLRAKKIAQIKALFHIREANRAIKTLENHKVVCKKCKIAFAKNVLTYGSWIDLSNFNYYKHDDNDNSNL